MPDRRLLIPFPGMPRNIRWPINVSTSQRQGEDLGYRILVMVSSIIDTRRFTGVYRGQLIKCVAYPSTTGLTAGDVVLVTRLNSTEYFYWKVGTPPPIIEHYGLEFYLEDANHSPYDQTPHVDGSHILIPANASLKSTPEVTYEFFHHRFDPGDLAIGTVAYPLWKAGQVLIEVLTPRFAFTNYDFYISVGGAWVSIGTVSVHDNTWYHFAIQTWDDGGGVYKAGLYFNGGQISVTALAGPPEVVDSDLWISGSRRLYTGMFGGGHPVWSWMDEIRFSNITRYNRSGGYTVPTAPLVVDANTMALWRLEEDIGATTYDATANDNDGTLTGPDFPSWIAGYPWP